ncbi:adenylyltransferase/cytidyltransferase family protein [Peribacillus loiseleuriae]|uniref:adenylyltransferase/cytidyltransferase family protein n=1 Tax=Peribacillus loiseleuriae TaxID=1679170 RepID=UPI003D00A580
MKTIYLTNDNLDQWQRKARPNVIALGCFDGLHIGHQKVIHTAWQKANELNLSLSVMSFFPHPKIILLGDKHRFHYLMPQSEKEEKLKSLGVDTFYQLKFDHTFASLSPEQFVHNYLIKLGVVHAVAGFDFSYGSRGAGNMKRLHDDSNGLIQVTKVEKVEFAGEKISSSLIREKLHEGNVEELSNLLGHSYEVKCDWGGSSLIPHPYYTLPAQGNYYVSIKNEFGSIGTVVEVFDDNGVQSLRCEGLSPLKKGKCSVIWHHHLPKEKRKLRPLVSFVPYSY